MEAPEVLARAGAALGRTAVETEPVPADRMPGLRERDDHGGST